jgi:hypothetical protein
MIGRSYAIEPSRMAKLQNTVTVSIRVETPEGEILVNEDYEDHVRSFPAYQKLHEDRVGPYIQLCVISYAIQTRRL